MSHVDEPLTADDHFNAATLEVSELLAVAGLLEAITGDSPDGCDAEQLAKGVRALSRIMRQKLEDIEKHLDPVGHAIVPEGRA